MNWNMVGTIFTVAMAGFNVAMFIIIKFNDLHHLEKKVNENEKKHQADHEKYELANKEAHDKLLVKLESHDKLLMEIKEGQASVSTAVNMMVSAKVVRRRISAKK